jgi:hypothetical protein
MVSEHRHIWGCELESGIGGTSDSTRCSEARSVDDPSRRRNPPSGEPTSPTNAVTLQPNSRGYLAVETESGSISCLVREDLIACETPATNWPLHEDGTPYHSFIGYASGSIEWADGQMGDLPRTRLGDREYLALGWTIVTIEDGLRFVRDQTGHGICVTTRGVRAF